MTASSIRATHCRRDGCPKVCALSRWCAARRVPAAPVQEFTRTWTSNVYKAGNHLFFQGNQPIAVHFLCTGRVKLVRTDCGRRKILRTVAAPAFLGEAAALARTPYACDAEATETVLACVVETARFRALFDDMPEAARALSLDLARELDEIESEIADLAIRTVRERLAKFLDEESGGRGAPIRLRESRQELAERLGTSPEIVSRAFADLEEAAVVAVRGRDVRVLHAARLRAAARLPARRFGLRS